MSVSTHFRPNIHQNGPEILGVKIGKIKLANAKFGEQSSKILSFKKFELCKIVFLKKKLVSTKFCFLVLELYFCQP